MLLIDTREKTAKIEHITRYMDEMGVEYDRTKLYFGDFQFFDNPRLVIDRKQDIQELAQNVTVEVERFKRELNRAQVTGSRLVVLVEQNRYKVTTGTTSRTVKVETLDDLYLWKHQHANIYGEHVARVIQSLMARYPLEVEFCDKHDTGERILRILENG